MSPLLPLLPVIAGLLLMPAPVSASFRNADPVEAEYVSGEVIVRFTPDVEGSTAKKRKFAKHRDLKESKDASSDEVAVFRIQDGDSVEKKVKELISDPAVMVVQPNYRYEKFDIESDDTHKADLWALDNTGQTVNGVSGSADADVDAPEAWAINEGTNDDVIVAVIDDGVAYNHPDLAVNMWDGSSCVDEDRARIGGGCLHGYDFENDDSNPLPDDSHGTHVAGIIAAVKNNTKGVIGVAPHAKIMALRSSLTTSELVRAIAFAENNGAKVINASFGGGANDPALASAISNFPGIFVASAGNAARNNDASGNKVYPCALSVQIPSVICVAATDQDDGLASFSNYGASSVSVAAPGKNIFSTVGHSEPINMDFQDLTVPGVPAGWVATGNFGSVSEGGNKKLVGDTNRSPYLDNADNSLITPTYDTSSARGGLRLSFNVACDTEYAPEQTDYLQIDISSDGGASWSLAQARIDERTLDGDANPAGSASLVITVPITPSEGTKIRFRWITDGNADADHAGCTLDNMLLRYFGDGSDAGYEFFQGTSMAAPMVSGVAALAWGYRPTLAADVIVDAAIRHGDILPSLSGKVLSGMRVNGEKTLLSVRGAKNITDVYPTTAPDRSLDIDNTLRTVSVGVPIGTNISAMALTIIHEGASVSPASDAIRDFTNPVVYTVTALDGSTKSYTVTVSTVSTPTVTSFEFTGVVARAAITGNTIAITVPYGTNVRNLIPAITHTGSVITPASGVVQDFTNPITYTLLDADGFRKTYTVRVSVGAHPFVDAEISFRGGSTHLGKTSETRVRVDFDGVSQAVYYMLSKHEDFRDEEWKPMTDSVTLRLKKKDGKQRFYFRFKDADGVISETEKKTLTYVPEKQSIKNSRSRVEHGGTIIRTGKNFSKNSSVTLFFSVADQSYSKITVPTDSRGRFTSTFTANLPKGKYSWYAVDQKTKKKSEKLSYRVF